MTKKGQKTVFRTENNKNFHEQKTTLDNLKNTKLTLGLKVNVKVLYMLQHKVVRCVHVRLNGRRVQG